MITIFTRKELLITFDMKHQADVRDILAANDIDYIVKVTDRQDAAVISRGGAREGSLGMNQNYAYEYKIYVHKKDYENALRLIG